MNWSDLTSACLRLQLRREQRTLDRAGRSGRPGKVMRSVPPQGGALRRADRSQVNRFSILGVKCICVLLPLEQPPGIRTLESASDAGTRAGVPWRAAKTSRRPWLALLRT